MCENLLKEKAIEYARAHKKEIAKKFTDTSIYKSEEEPISVFMAGSPGAGKTESSRELLKEITGNDPRQKIIRIDADELRDLFKPLGYDGTNSHIFQYPVSILVSKIHDFVISQSQSFILDSTFSDLERARQNIKRSINKNRFIQILYIYQDPKQAWEFVKEREVNEGRRIRKIDFITKYFDSRYVVNQIKKEFGKMVQLDLIHKNNDHSKKLYKRNVQSIDMHIPEIYNSKTLNKILS